MQKTEIKTYRIDKECDCTDTGDGLLQFTGEAIQGQIGESKSKFSSTINLIDATLYIHICNKCNKRVELVNEFYPKTIHEDVKRVPMIIKSKTKNDSKNTL